MRDPRRGELSQTHGRSHSTGNEVKRSNNQSEGFRRSREPPRSEPSESEVQWLRAPSPGSSSRADFISMAGWTRPTLRWRPCCRRADTRFISSRISVDPCLRAHPQITVTQVDRPAGSFFLGDWLLGLRGKAIARATLAQSLRTRVVSMAATAIGTTSTGFMRSITRGRAFVDHAPLWFKLKSRIDKSIARRREKSALRESRIVIANSNRTRNDLIALGVPAEKIHTIYLGADPTTAITAAERIAARAWLGVDPKRPLAAFVGALGFDTNKGIDTLVEAWRRLVSRPDWDVDLIVAGGGRGVESWRRRIEEIGISSRIKMLGFTDRVAELLAGCDVLVSPVRYEAYGLGVQEALCRGVPAIVSAAAGISERYPAELSGLIWTIPPVSMNSSSGCSPGGPRCPRGRRVSNRWPLSCARAPGKTWRAISSRSSSRQLSPESGAASLGSIPQHPASRTE